MCQESALSNELHPSPRVSALFSGLPRVTGPTCSQRAHMPRCSLSLSRFSSLYCSLAQLPDMLLASLPVSAVLLEGSSESLNFCIS